MDLKEFNEILDNQIAICKNILIDKAKEYATEDRLHNFKVAAEMQGCTPIRALAGMMAKHTTSIYDMCISTTFYRQYSSELWDEKITDHINYLILLKALILENRKEKTSNESM